MAGEWTNEEKRKIFEVFAVLAADLKNYGAIDHKARLQAWQAVLADEMTGDEICASMIALAKINDQIPTAAQLRAFKFQPPKQITYAEYKHAIEMHALEGYPMFGYYGQIIRNYESQTAEIHGTKTYHQILEARKQQLIAPELKQKLIENGASLTVGEKANV